MGLQKKKSTGTDYQQVIQDSLRKRDYGAAIGAFKALLKDKDSAQMRLRFADTLVLAGRKEDALEEYRRAAEEMAQQGQLVLAIATFKKLAKLDPGQADILENIARLHAQRGLDQPALPPPPVPKSADRDDMGLDFGMEEGDAAELDIGFGGSNSSSPMPEHGVSVDVGSAELGGVDLAADDLGADDLGADDLGASDLGASDLGASDLGADDLGADDLGADDLGASDRYVGDAAISDVVANVSSVDLGSDLAPELGSNSAASSFNPGGLGFDFVGTSTAPAAATPAPELSSGLGFDFGSSPKDSAPSVEPAPIAGGAFSFNFGQPGLTPPETSEVTTAAKESQGGFMSFGAPTAATSEKAAPVVAMDSNSPPVGLNEIFPGGGVMGDDGGFGSDANPFAGDEEGNLLNLLGDDIEMMIDGIISDVGDENIKEAVALGPMETNIRLFAHLAIDEFVEVLKLLDREMAKAGQDIVRQGDSGASMYIISDGSVEAIVDRDGQPVKIAALGDGDFFGEMSVLSGAPRTATIRASKDTELLVLERDKLREIFTRFPEIEAKLRLAHDERAEALSRR